MILAKGSRVQVRNTTDTGTVVNLYWGDEPGYGVMLNGKPGITIFDDGELLPLPAGWIANEHAPYHMVDGGKCWCWNGHPYAYPPVDPMP